ncbi:hypothetical protein O9929_14415 [Vibrio lentus]|nr:hypothetical protein [Vibrio lentus]
MRSVSTTVMRNLFNDPAKFKSGFMTNVCVTSRTSSHLPFGESEDRKSIELGCAIDVIATLMAVFGATTRHKLLRTILRNLV